ncbi:hypothetical protein J4E91_006775 [Alternaria rosae]|nr:hypothetical protein J4E91_006775 [Alternaria rosae]
MSQGPPTYPYNTNVALTMNEEETASGRQHEVWSVIGAREQNTGKNRSAQILGMTGSIKGEETVEKSTTGIQQKYGDNTIKSTGAITATETIDDSSTGLIIVEGATGSAKITEDTGNIAAKRVKGTSTGITYSR